MVRVHGTPVSQSLNHVQLLFSHKTSVLNVCEKGQNSLVLTGDGSQQIVFFPLLQFVFVLPSFPLKIKSNAVSIICSIRVLQWLHKAENSYCQ